MDCSVHSQEFKVQEGRKVLVEGEIQEDTGKSVPKEDTAMRNPHKGRLADIVVGFLIYVVVLRCHHSGKVHPRP